MSLERIVSSQETAIPSNNEALANPELKDPANAALRLAGEDFIAEAKSKEIAFAGWLARATEKIEDKEQEKIVVGLIKGEKFILPASIAEMLAMSLDPVELAGKKDIGSLGEILTDLEPEEVPFIWDIFTEALAKQQGKKDGDSSQSLWQIIKTLRLLYSDAVVSKINGNSGKVEVSRPENDLFGKRRELEAEELEKVKQIFSPAAMDSLINSGFLEEQTSLSMRRNMRETISGNWQEAETSERIVENFCFKLKKEIEVARLLITSSKGIDATEVKLALAALAKQIKYYEAGLSKKLEYLSLKLEQSGENELALGIAKIKGQKMALADFERAVNLAQEINGVEEPVLALNKLLADKLRDAKIEFNPENDFIPGLLEIIKAAFPGSISKRQIGEEVGVEIEKWVREKDLLGLVMVGLRRLQKETLAYRLSRGDILMAIDDNKLARKIRLLLTLGSPEKEEEAKEILSGKDYFGQVVLFIVEEMIKSHFLREDEDLPKALLHLILADNLRRLGKKQTLSVLAGQSSLLELPFLTEQAWLDALDQPVETGAARLEKISKKVLLRAEHLAQKIRERLSIAEEDIDLVKMAKNISLFLYNTVFPQVPVDVKEPFIRLNSGLGISGETGSGKTMVALVAAAELGQCLKEMDKPEPVLIRINGARLTPEGIVGPSVLNQIAEQLINQVMDLFPEIKTVDSALEFIRESGRPIIVLVDEGLNLLAVSGGRNAETLKEMSNRVAQEMLNLLDPLEEGFSADIEATETLSDGSQVRVKKTVKIKGNMKYIFTGSLSSVATEIKRILGQDINEDFITIDEFRSLLEQAGIRPDFFNRLDFVRVKPNEELAKAAFENDFLQGLKNRIKLILQAYGYNKVEVECSFDISKAEQYIARHFEARLMRAPADLVNAIFYQWAWVGKHLTFPTGEELIKGIKVEIDNSLLKGAIESLEGSV